MSLTIPFTFVATQKAKSSQVNANFAAVAAKFSAGAGGINDTDISSNADIDCNKLSSTFGKRLVANRFEVGAVDKDALKKDATAGSPAAAVNEAAHIKDGIIGKNKIDVTNRLSYAQLDLLIEAVPYDVACGPFTLGNGRLTRCSTVRAVSGSNYVVTWYFSLDDGVGGNKTDFLPAPITPTTPIPTLSRHFVGAYLTTPTFVNGVGNTTHMQGTMVVISIAKT